MTLFLFLNDFILKALSGQSKALGGGRQDPKGRNGESNRSRGPPGASLLQPRGQEWVRGAHPQEVGPTLRKWGPDVGPSPPSAQGPVGRGSLGSFSSLRCKCSQAHAHRAHLAYLQALAESGTLLHRSGKPQATVMTLPVCGHSCEASRKAWGLRAWCPAVLGKGEGFPVLAMTFPDTSQPNVWPLGSMKILQFPLPSAVVSGFLFEVRLIATIC